MKYDLDEARRKAETKEQAELKKRERKRAKAEAARLKKRRDEARRIIDSIPKLMNRESRGGNRSAEVMRIEDRHYRRPLNDARWDFCDPEWLQGAAKEVYDHCDEYGLKPRLEHCGIGLRVRFRIIISW